MATVYTLDLTPNWSYTETVTVSQDDVGREIEFDLTLDGATYAIPSGATVTMHGTKPSGLGFTVTGSFTANDDAVTFSTTEGMTQEYGRFPAEVVITSSGTVIGTANFDLWIEKSPHPSSTTDGTTETMQTLEARVAALENGASTVPTSVRSAIYTLLNNAAYTTTGLDDEIAVVEAWATAVTAITLNQTSISISGSGTVQLTATTTPSGGSVSWASSDTSVATVSSSGLVTSVGNGTATITATSGDVSATCTVTVSGIATLTGISAVYTQSGTVYTTTSLDDLKSDLVVTATYDDSSTATIASADYTLSGTLAEGTSAITVSYGGKTTTFNVTVTAPLTVTSISAVYTQSGTVTESDDLSSLTSDLVVTATWSDSSTSTVTSADYTLSGTLTAGTTSTITVSYGGQTTTFSVTVSEYWKVLNVQNQFLDGYANNDSYGSTNVPYTSTDRADRTSYPYFDILISSSYTYTFEYDGSGVSLGLPWYKSGVVALIEAQSSISSVKTDAGWKSSGYSFTPGSDAYCVRLTLNKSMANITSAGMTEIRITRTAVE